MDGHSSHMTIEVIKKVRANNVHLLCLPAHTIHILQPLDIGVFKPFKTNFSKACSKYIAENPGRVVTTEKIASLVAEAWSLSFTALNIMAGFKKAGVFPINPSEITDRQTKPSKGVRPPSQVAPSEPSDDPQPEILSPSANKACSTSAGSTSPLFLPEKEELYRKRFEEGYDLRDPDYIAWVEINHPTSDLCSVYSSSSTSKDPSGSDKCEGRSYLSDILVLPQPKAANTKSSSKQSLNKNTVCITDDIVYEGLKAQAEKKVQVEAEKERKKVERDQKKEKQKLLAEKKKKEKEEKKKEREEKKLEEAMRQLGKDASTDDQDIVTCPKCGLVCEEGTGMWLCCDRCEKWYDKKCANIKTRRLPKFFFCENCA